jgi:catechol 2,3-dioxygenase-like lactoylglutathione lyase family enzyme
MRSPRFPGMKVLFIASFAPIVSNVPKSHAFYLEGLGLSFDHKQGDYVSTEKIGGAKHFGLWPLSDAAQACFGTAQWPPDVPVPQASMEFEVDDVEAAAKELEASNHRPLHPTKKEPWGQTIARFLSPEGLLVGVCYTPWLREGA